MGIDILLQRYLRGGFNIDIASLSNGDKVRYQQTINLLEGILKGVNQIFDLAEKVRKNRGKDNKNGYMP